MSFEFAARETIQLAAEAYVPKLILKLETRNPELETRNS
jgi:hypothetical protein